MPRRRERQSYECLECHKIYYKAEHLARHERTHTGSKPYSCHNCGRSFSRQDSLARHVRRETHACTVPNSTTAAINAPAESSGSAAASDSLGNHMFQDHQRNISIDNVGQQNSLLRPEVLSAESLLSDSISGPVIGDPFFQLTWPDSEDLLHSLFSAESGIWHLPSDALPTQPPITSGPQPAEVSAISPWLTPSSVDSNGHGGNQAVQNLSQIITSLSIDVTSKAEATGFTTVFLDGCLHMFFTNFVPSFPVVHRPTFVFRNWTHPLLLNAIALGSLHMSQKDNAVKGETLWQLAHTAVATSWNTLIEHQGPYDTCSGVQLVLTALLGQVYAMFSANVKLRSTAQIFHSLGFYWARQSGMFNENIGSDTITSINFSHEQATESWSTWAARETQLRALLGHYILDGQIAHYTGGPTCQRHASNYLRLPCANAIYDAPTAEDWITRMRAFPPEATTFADLFNVLFSVEEMGNRVIPTSISLLTTNVLLEGLKSFVLESNEADRQVIGIPDKRSIQKALGKMHQCIMRSDQMSSVDRCNALLRWHAVSLDAATDSVALCLQMCAHFSIEQTVFGGKSKCKRLVNLRDWVSTSQAKRALLHAVAIWDTLQDLPLGRPHAIHIPASIFSAAIIYCAFCIAGAPVVQIPVVNNWQTVMAIETVAGTVNCPERDIQIMRYFTNALNPSKFGTGPTRTLLYDVNSLHSYMRSLSKPWPITATLAEILESLIAFCNA